MEKYPYCFNDQMKEYREYLVKPYFKAVNTLALRKSDEVFSNSGSEKAIAVLSNIFLTSEEEVCLFTDNLKPNVTSDRFYCHVVSEFIKQGKKIYLLVKNGIEPINAFPFYKLIIDSTSEANSNVKWKKANDQILDEIAKIFNGKQLNFAVGDERAIRIETDTVNFKAICSFNEHEYSKKLSALVKKFV
jgi:hypothetical protein